MAITPTQQAIDSLIVLHSPQLHEIAFALAVIDITLIKIDSFSDSFSIHKVREVLAAYLDPQKKPQLPEISDLQPLRPNY
jgi:hypothetical protein